MPISKRYALLTFKWTGVIPPAKMKLKSLGLCILILILHIAALLNISVTFKTDLELDTVRWEKWIPVALHMEKGGKVENQEERG